MLSYPYVECQRAEVEALGIHTNYYMAGRANGRPPVILLHGTSTSGDSFREMMHRLSDRYQLIAPDIPGFGFSEDTEPYTFPHLVEWLAAFRDALDLPPTAVAGHSFGGMLATTFALSYPEDVTRLLLLAPAILTAQQWPDVPMRWSISMGLVDVGSALTQKPPLVQRFIKVPFYDVDGQDTSVWERRMRDYENARSSADVIKALATYDVVPLLPQWQKPVALIWGAQDQIVSPTNAQSLQTFWPQAEVHLLSDCGHVPMIEKQPVVETIARSFLG